MSNSLGTKIRESRKKRGLSQEQLGNIVGVTKQAISKIEKGTTEEPDKRTLILLAKALNDGFGLDWLEEHLTGEYLPSREEIIQQATPEEVFGIGYGGRPTVRRSRSELLRFRALADKQLKEMDKNKES